MTRISRIQAAAILALAFSANLTIAQTPAPVTQAGGLVSGYGKLPLAFEVNRGQTDGRVKFLSHGRGYALFLTSDQAILTLAKSSRNANREGQTSHVKNPGKEKLKTENPQLASVLRMKLMGANAGAAAVGAEELPGKSNYFIGNDPKKWRKNVPNYAKVRYQDVYPGVDLVYYGNQGGQLEYDFVVSPGADPHVVALDVVAGIAGGANRKRRSSLRIAANGDLVFKTDGGEVRFQKPVVYQEQFATRHSVDGRYVLQGKHGIGFEVPSYDHSKPLIIDPVLSYSTYLGGIEGYGIAVDSAGNAYITGIAGPNFLFPTPGAFQTVSDGTNDAFITKLNASGSAQVFSTYLSGSANVGGKAQGLGIAVDSAGNAYVTGWTTATDFPTTPGAFQRAIGDPTGYSAFVTKLNAAGSALVYSTYLGGNRVDMGYAIALDSAGNAYVTGQTDSTNFPTAGPFQAAFGGGGTNAFVTKLNTVGSALVYSTYLGGNASDTGYGIAVDSSNNAYVTGFTTSPNFPTVNPFQSTLKSSIGNAFVTKLNAAGNALVYSTYLGGNGSGDYGKGIAVDSAGNAYVTGFTTSTNYPTANPFQAACSGTIPGCVIVTKLNATGSALVYSTYLGGTSDQGNGIAVDSAGNAYVTGVTGSATFPLANPIQATCGNCSQNGAQNVFVTNLNAAGTALIYSTYLTGSSGADSGEAIAVDAAGNAYLTGKTGSADYPTTPGAYQTSLLPNQFVSVFVAKIAPGNAAPATSLSSVSLTFSAQNVGTTSTAQTETVTNTGTASLSISTVALGGANAGDFAKSSDTCTGATVAPAGTCEVTLTFTPSAAGSRSASLSFADNAASSPQQVTLSGTGVATAPQAVLTPSPVPFGNQMPGTSSNVQVVVLSNPGTASLNISSLSVTGANVSAFPIQSACGAILLANASCNISVMFSPTTTGPLSAAITVVDNAANSPQSDTLTGTGTVALVPQANLSPATLTFASQVNGTTSAAQTVTLSNPGNATLTITGITLTGANPTAFVLTNGCGTSLAASANCLLSVTFSPGTVGTFAAAITVADNAAGSPQSVALSGTGAAPPDFTTSSPTPPQTVTAGAAATYQINVASATGVFNLPVTLSATGLPAGATAVFTPPIVTPGSAGATSSLVIQTSATMAELRDDGPEHRRPARSNSSLFEIAASGIGMACLLFFRRIPQLNHGRSLLLVVAGLFLMSLGISACGGGFPESATARSFIITITGTNGSDIHATTISLTVK